MSLYVRRIQIYLCKYGTEGKKKSLGKNGNDKKERNEKENVKQCSEYFPLG
jgi:hypothetical protein